MTDSLSILRIFLGERNGFRFEVEFYGDLSTRGVGSLLDYLAAVHGLTHTVEPLIEPHTLERTRVTLSGDEEAVMAAHREFAAKTRIADAQAKMIRDPGLVVALSDYLSPDWENPPPNVSDWMECVSDDLRAIWHTFTPKQRRVIYENAQSCWSSLDHERWLDPDSS